MPVVIKNVSKESWRILKAEAAKHGVATGKMLEILVKEHMKNENKKDLWNKILKSKPRLKNKEADRLKKEMERFRKEFEMRL